MTLKSHLLFAGSFALFALPASAFAQSAAVAPFVANGVDAKVSANITALASSEMDFMSEYDGAEELGSTPGMNQWCLDNPGCMATIASRRRFRAVCRRRLIVPIGLSNYSAISFKD